MPNRNPLYKSWDYLFEAPLIISANKNHKGMDGMNLKNCWIILAVLVVGAFGFIETEHFTWGE